MEVDDKEDVSILRHALWTLKSIKDHMDRQQLSDVVLIGE